MTCPLGRFGLIFVLYVLAATMIMSKAHGQGLPDLTRRDREARTLFQTVLARESPAGQCQYNLDWAREELPDYVARAEFNIAAGAGLMPPFTTGDFRSIADPNHHIADTAFCSDEALKAYTALRVAEFEKSPESYMQIDQTGFDHPIFNKSRTKAVVIVMRLALEQRSRSLGKLLRLPNDSATRAGVYRKAGGLWRFVRSTSLGGS